MRYLKNTVITRYINFNSLHLVCYEKGTNLKKKDHWRIKQSLFVLEIEIFNYYKYYEVRILYE